MPNRFQIRPITIPRNSIHADPKQRSQRGLDAAKGMIGKKIPNRNPIKARKKMTPQTGATAPLPQAGGRFTTQDFKPGRDDATASPLPNPVGGTPPVSAFTGAGITPTPAPPAGGGMSLPQGFAQAPEMTKKHRFMTAFNKSFGAKGSEQRKKSIGQFGLMATQVGMAQGNKMSEFQNRGIREALAGQALEHPDLGGSSFGIDESTQLAQKTLQQRQGIADAGMAQSQAQHDETFGLAEERLGFAKETETKRQADARTLQEFQEEKENIARDQKIGGDVSKMIRDAKGKMNPDTGESMAMSQDDVTQHLQSIGASPEMIEKLIGIHFGGGGGSAGVTPASDGADANSVIEPMPTDGDPRFNVSPPPTQEVRGLRDVANRFNSGR